MWLALSLEWENTVQTRVLTGKNWLWRKSLSSKRHKRKVVCMPGTKMAWHRIKGNKNPAGCGENSTHYSSCQGKQHRRLLVRMCYRKIHQTRKGSWRCRCKSDPQWNYLSHREKGDETSKMIQRLEFWGNLGDFQLLWDIRRQDILSGNGTSWALEVQAFWRWIADEKIYNSKLRQTWV